MDGPKDQGRVDRGDGEVRFFLFREFPGRFLGEGFGGAVAAGGVLDGFFCCDGVPILFAVGVAGSGRKLGGDDGGEGTSDDLIVFF